MKKIKIILGIVLILLCVSFTFGRDFTPHGNITGRDVYTIYNFTNITTNNKFCISNYCITSWDNITSNYYQTSEIDVIVNGNISYLNSSLRTYINDQDILYNDSMKSYVDDLDTQQQTYVDDQDILYNDSMKSYVDDQDILYNDSVVDTNCSALGSCSNITYDNEVTPSYPTSVNLTSGDYNGDVNGYKGANDICQSEYSESHLCNEFEIVRAYNGGVLNLNNSDGWMSAGGPKYVPADIPVNDCNGWTYSGTSSALGNYWHFNNETGGEGRAINCGTELPLVCCSY